ncbi:hypothetical protein [Cupriavidus taiwanensis]|uniref:hypothetical protein n=1 Tax=Cupriavidus taiwanensis TaxID=164546 RepID=UPI000E180595|nr:hypothetical protein [Cupriavidus taiwanensis]SPA17212.1 conserved hypothetical protein [Cupriavidus taiwanensis]
MTRSIQWQEQRAPHVDGFFYLHREGDLLFKRNLPHVEDDLRRAEFVLAFWPVDWHNRETQWRMLIEAMAGGAQHERVMELARHWLLTNDDAQEYARRISVELDYYEPGGLWRACCLRLPAACGTGQDALHALASLAQVLGLRIGKHRYPTFSELATGGY